MSDQTPGQFMEYFRVNYPGPDTIIHNPDWHAPKIYRAAIHASGLRAELDRLRAERVEILKLAGRREVFLKEHGSPGDLNPVEAVRNELGRLRAELKAEQVRTERALILADLSQTNQVRWMRKHAELEAQLADDNFESCERIKAKYGEASQRLARYREALDRNRREFLSMKQALQRGVLPHDLSDQVIRCHSDTQDALRDEEKA